MPHNCCSGTFSSRSFGGYLSYPGASCGSSYPGKLVYSTNLCSPSTCQLGSSLYSGCQETCCEPTSCQTSYVVSSPCQTSCYRPRTSTVCTPCQTTYSGSLGFGSSSCRSLGYGSRSCYSLGCGSSGFRPLSYGGCGFPSLGCGYGFCRPSYLASRSCQSSCYRPTCGSGFY
ncbi:keratin-associated protein 13-1 [Daubentonia madagascariensis]|uniref:Keratin-associated protein n=1 Tax=Daubentonia madagascariensis TaxID=31869 RepID=A0ABD2FA02_DAUMA